MPIRDFKRLYFKEVLYNFSDYQEAFVNRKNALFLAKIEDIIRDVTGIDLPKRL